MTVCDALVILQRRKKKKIALRNCGTESAGATKLFRPKKSAATAALRTKNARTIWSNASKKKAWKNATNVHNSRAKKSKACSNAPPSTKGNAKNCAHAKNTRCWKNHFSGKKKICENKNSILEKFCRKKQCERKKRKCGLTTFSLFDNGREILFWIQFSFKIFFWFRPS